MNSIVSLTMRAFVLAAAASAVYGADPAIQVSSALKESSASNGVLMRVTIENAGQAPYSLMVCPAMTLCCVRGLHPVISMEDTGQGLLDLCRTEKPTPHEAFLPAGAAFSFDVRIPVTSLPEKCRASGAKFTVGFFFKNGEYKVESKPVPVTLAP